MSVYPPASPVSSAITIATLPSTPLIWPRLQHVSGGRVWLRMTIGIRLSTATDFQPLQVAHIIPYHLIKAAEGRKMDGLKRRAIAILNIFGLGVAHLIKGTSMNRPRWGYCRRACEENDAPSPHNGLSPFGFFIPQQSTARLPPPPPLHSWPHQGRPNRLRCWMHMETCETAL